MFTVHVRGTIRFFVQQVAPVCRAAGSFKVRGHRGVNRIRFSGTLHGHRLRSGTYVIHARTKTRTVFLKTVVVNARGPGLNACASAQGGTSASGGSTTGGAVASGSNGNSASNGSAGKNSSGASNASMGAPRSSGVLGARASKVLPGSGSAQLALLLVLTAAILLLGLGALPRQVVPHPAAAAFLVRRRSILAAAGFAALAAFLVSYFLT